MTQRRFWHRAGALADYTLTICIRIAWVGVITFETSGFILELTGLSLRKGGFPTDIGYGLGQGIFAVLLLILPAIALTIVLGGTFLAVALRFEIRRPEFYCVAGLVMGLIALPLLSKIGGNSLRTWTQLLIEPGIRLCLSGLLAGLVLWRSVKATT